MESLIEYLDMGGYAMWVWPSYGLAALALIGTLAATLRTLKHRQRELDDLKSLRKNPSDN